MTQTGGLQKSGVSCHDFAYCDGTVHESKPANSPKLSSIIHKLTGRNNLLQERVTYILSASSLMVLQSRRVYDDIKTLLNRPRITLILLVPVKLVVHSAALNLSRLPRATESNLRIFPFDPLSTVHDDDVKQCIWRVANVKRVNGYMSFEEDGESRMRIAALARLVND